jgi:hypothetical protein
MLQPQDALSTIPAGLRDPLIAEFKDLVQNYLERKWGPAELSGGRFCEVVYTILEGHAKGKYANAPAKPNDFVGACRRFESNTHVPRSFQILIPRLLPGLYEIRNNRNVGHVGGDVSPDVMDASAVISIASWVMAELVRVYHNVSTAEAQGFVDSLAERRLPLVWKSGDLRRVLDPQMTLKDQTLILLASASGSRVGVDDLIRWTDYHNRGYFLRLIRQLHKARFLEFHAATNKVEMLPPGSDYVSQLVQNRVHKS